MKTIYYETKAQTKAIRKQFLFYYTEKFFNKWMSKYDYPELNYQQKNFIMRRWWAEGNVACIRADLTNEPLAGLIKDDVVKLGSNQLLFVPWAPAGLYNIYDYVIDARAINKRGVKFIPEKALEVDKDIVIGYAQKNKKSVYSSIEAKLYELVDVEMKKRLARKAQAQPWLFAFSDEDREQAKKLQEQLENDNPYLFMPLSEVNNAKAFTSGAPYIVDKLEQDRQKIENDILTILGVNNVGIGEKKEHLIVDEVNANNEDIEQSSYSYKNEIEEFFDRVYKVLGYKVSVIDLNEVFKEAEDEVDEKESEEDGQEA